MEIKIYTIKAKWTTQQSLGCEEVAGYNIQTLSQPRGVWGYSHGFSFQFQMKEKRGHQNQNEDRNLEIVSMDLD